MSNPCAFPVEVYCLDLDKQYMMDEDVLRNVEATRYNEAGVMRQPPLQPGQQIWSELAEEAEKRKLAAAEAAAVDSGPGTAGAESTPAAEDAEVGDLDAVPPEPAAAPRLVVVLHGPPMIGSTTQASLLAKRYDVPVVTFDDLLYEAADIEAPPAAEPLASGEGSEGAAAEAPFFDPEISDLLYSKVLIDPDLEAQPGFIPPASSLPEAELVDLLVRGLKQALEAPRPESVAGAPGPSPSRYSKGLVLDGIRSKYCAPGIASKVLMQALGMQAVLPEAPPPAAAPKAAKKGAPEPPPPPPPSAEGWNGPHDVFFLTFDATLDHVKGRLHAKKEAEKAMLLSDSAVADAEVEGVIDGSSNGEADAELTDEERAARTAAAAEAARLAAEAADAELTAEAEALLQTFVSEASAVSEQLGKDGFAGNRAVRRRFDPAGPTDRVLAAACGIEFRMGEVSVALPRLESDAMLLPDPYIVQVVQKPRNRQVS